MKGIRNVISKICKGVNYIGMVATFVVMIILVLDIVLHQLTPYRVLGNYEMTEMGMTLIIFFAVAATQVDKGHVRVDMFISFIPKKGRLFVDGIVTLITAIVCGLMTYAAFAQAGTYSASNTSTAVLHIPYAPFGYVYFIGFLLLTLVILIDAIDLIIEGVKYKGIAITE